MRIIEKASVYPFCGKFSPNNIEPWFMFYRFSMFSRSGYATFYVTYSLLGIYLDIFGKVTIYDFCYYIRQYTVLNRLLLNPKISHPINFHLLSALVIC